MRTWAARAAYGPILVLKFRLNTDHNASTTHCRCTSTPKVSLLGNSAPARARRDRRRLGGGHLLWSVRSGRDDETVRRGRPCFVLGAWSRQVSMVVEGVSGTVDLSYAPVRQTFDSPALPAADTFISVVGRERLWN